MPGAGKIKLHTSVTTTLDRASSLDFKQIEGHNLSTCAFYLT